MPATTPETRWRVLRMVRLAEAQRVQAAIGRAPMVKTSRRMPPTPGRRALIGLDEGGMVVALHLEDEARPSPMSITPAFSPGPWMTHGALVGSVAQCMLRGFVGAVLVPHRREDAELGEGRLAADQVQDALVFVGLQPVLGDQLRGDGERRCGSCRLSLLSMEASRNSHLEQGCRRALRDQRQCVETRLSNRPRPSVPPTRASIRFSGCGIMPSTLSFRNRCRRWSSSSRWGWRRRRLRRCASQ